MNRLFRPQARRRFRHALVFAAALPLLQFGACGTAVGQTFLTTSPQIPSIVVNSLASALLETLFSAIGLSSLFGGNNNNNNNNGLGGNSGLGGNGGLGGGSGLGS